MSYLDALKDQTIRRPKVDVETDIGQPNDPKEHEEMMKLFNEMPREVQLRIRTKVEQRRRQSQGPVDKKVAANELRNQNQEKLKANLKYRNEVKRKRKRAIAKAKEKGKR